MHVLRSALCSLLTLHPAALLPLCSQAWDIAIGAAAGVASVLVSMPFDVIKTYMQTHGAEAAAAGARGQLAAFWATGAVLLPVTHCYVAHAASAPIR
jgi:hypothetical protein